MLASSHTGQTTASNPTGRAKKAPYPGNRRKSQAVNGAAQRLAPRKPGTSAQSHRDQLIEPATNLP